MRTEGLPETSAGLYAPQKQKAQGSAIQRRRTNGGGSLARSNALTKRSETLSRGNGLRSRIARTFGDSLSKNVVVGGTTLAPKRTSRGAGGNERTVPRCRGRRHGGHDGPEGNRFAGSARAPLPPRPGGDISGALRSHSVAPNHDGVVPTISDYLNAVPIGSLGDGTKRTSFGAEYVSSKLQPGSSRPGDSRPVRAAACNRVGESIRPPFTNSDKLTVGSAEADGLGA
jgi:hypothetical protein